MVWTEADAAELDVLVHELVRCTFAHRARCAHCRPGGRASCGAVGEAIEAVLDWRRWRGLRTAAVSLRARQDLTDLTTEAPERAARKEAA